MAECLISQRLLEVISKPPAGNAGSPKKPRFSDFQGHFREDECGEHPTASGWGKAETAGLP
jgi:hypothetical protein